MIFRGMQNHVLYCVAYFSQQSYTPTQINIINNYCTVCIALLHSVCMTNH